MMMFEKERFIEECRTALKESNPQAAIGELMRSAVSDPAQIVRALGEPRRAARIFHPPGWCLPWHLCVAELWPGIQ